ncbi:MAG: hypothetical protein JOY69_06190 [Candidatus Eremiobacteraeota bacterium]|nr:hypothetical protein [Candidatus Eremiobacteraeota bacterium]
MRVAFAADAGARIWELSTPNLGNAATSIGLLRDAVVPEPPSSPRDYIAAYTHPLPAGTFNRSYACSAPIPTVTGRTIACEYDAPDLPPGGGRFSRTLTLANGDASVAVDETLTPHDSASVSKLASVSGFAFQSGDLVIAPQGASYVGIFHAGRLAALR